MRLDEPATPGWTWRAIGCAAVAVFVIYLLGLVIAGMLGPLRLMGQTVACQANVMRLVRGMRMYADDYDDRFPPSAQWMSRVAFYLDDVRRLRCPTVAPPGDNRHFGYAMNSRASGKARRDINDPDTFPLVYDSGNLAYSVADPVTSLPVPGRHVVRRRNRPYGHGNVIGYSGGRVQLKVDRGR
jgi:hypothetical protein